jgi:hypothetical protein
MKKHLIVCLLSCFAVFALSVQAQTAALRNMEGRVTSLQGHMDSDKWTVVMIWASRCHVCN